MSNKLISKIFITLLFVLFIITGNSFAQLTGVKTIPGDYATIAAAITDLNTQGVGSGGVTFNVASGYTETITAPLVITATGTSSNPIIFQKSGSGANPLITRTDAGTISTSSIGADGDAVIRLNGTDYITFNGIDVTATDQGIEYGYYTFKPSGTDGCQFVTITNCVVTMTKGTSGFVIGINISNGPTSSSSATGVTVTAASGINSNITITGNTITNVHAGVYVRGSSAAGFYDSDITIGQSGAGNTITNFGGGSATTTYGVYFIYVNNPTVAYNTITSATHGSTLYGIFYSTVSGNVVGSNNNFNLANNSASSATQYIYNSNTVTSENFNNNTFAAGTLSSTGTVYLIYASSGTPIVNVSGNQTSGTITRTGASGSFYCYYNLGSPASGTETLSNNNFSNISVTGTSSLYGIYSNTATGQNRVSYNNTISNWTGGTGSCYAIYHLSTTSNTIYNNSIHDITTGGTFYGLYFSGTNPTVYGNNVYNITTSGTTLYGIYDAGTGTTNCYKNQVYNLTANNAAATLYGFYITTGTSNYVYNNFVSDLKTPILNSTTLTGMYISGGTFIGLYYNTIYLNATSSGANFGSSGIYASTTPTVELRNNIVVNTSTPAGTGLTVAYRRSTTSLTTYSAASNTNDFYAGTPSATNLIFYDGTNSDQTIASYKTRVSPRDANSFSENPPFVNATTAPYDLHLNPSIATQLESGGIPVTSPIAINDDFDGNSRNATTPDVGADEFNGTPLDLTPPAITFTPLSNTSYITNRQLTANISDPSGIASTPNDPRLYFRKKNDPSFVFVNASSVVGSNYTFIINYALLGSSVNVGDTIEYYLAAQDLSGNSGTSPIGGGGTPPGTIQPSTFYSYAIINALALPYLQDFNAGTSLPAGWSGNMLVLANHGTSGSNGLSKNLWSSAQTGFALTPIVGPITSNSEIVFDYRIVNYTGYPSTATTLAGDVFNIRISTDDGATYTTVYTIDSSNHVPSTSFATVNIPIGAFAGLNAMVRWDLQWNAGDYYFDIDNVKIREIPLGPPNPAVLVSPANGATNVSINTSLQWASGGGAPEAGYRIYFGTDGGGVTPPTNILNNVDLGLVTSYTPASPLAYSTTYYWMIVPYNGGGDASGNVIWSFTTGLNPTINTFPYVQDFEGTFPPYGWTNYGTKTWSQTTTGGNNGTKGARVLYNPAGTANLQTPPVVLPANPHRIKFWWKDNDISAKSVNNGEAMIEGTEVAGYDTTYFEISTDAGSSWTSLAFLSAASPQTSYNEVVVDLSSYASQTVYFRWRDVSDGSFSAWGTGLDDITIEEIPATPIFVISPTSQNFGSAIVGNSVSRNFTISNTGSVTLTINSGGITLTGANADQFSLGSITYPINLNSGESTQITVNFSPTSAGVKNANLQIVHNAPGSPAIVPLTGNALPLGTLFEDFTGTAFPPDGWLAVNNDGGAQNWFRSTSKFNSAPASAASYYEGSTLRNDDWLISPKVSVNAGDSLIFYSSIQSSTYPEILVIKVGLTADPNGSWTTIDSLVQSSTNWIRRAYNLSAFAGQNVYIAFVNRGLDEWVLYIDDVQGPIKYTPAVDLALQDLYQSTGLPVPRSGEKFNDYNISLNFDANSESKPFAKLENSAIGLRSTNTNNTILVESTNNPPFELNNVQLKGVVKNLGLNAASYNLNWNVSGTVQTPYTGPTLSSGSVDTANLTYSPSAIGTFLTSGTLVVTGDEVPGNDSKEFRMRVYPDSYTRTIYDRGDNLVDTWVGWGSSTIRMKAGVRFTASEQIKLAGVDFICRTEAVNSGTFEVQVRAAGDSAGAPGAVLYTKVYSANDYFAGAGDYIFFPFDNDAPTIASGSDYWITVKAPLGVQYPGAVHNNGFTAGRSFYESSTDTTVWNPLVITTERAWIMRAVHIPAASTFQLSVSVSNGWNMVSVPGLHPVDQNVTTWWSGKDPAANVFKFQGGYQAVTTVQPGFGYWMKHLGANTYNTGDEWPAGGINIVAHDPLNAAAGWNLIGGYEFLAPTAALTTNPSGLISGFVYGYTPGTGYQVASNLVPGYGYWVKLTAAGQININPGPKANFKLADLIGENAGKIIITDNAGKSYTLYVANDSKTSLDYFELPPVPFSDMFDVRYTSGRFVEELSSAVKTIQMQGVEYPVKVRVEGMMIRISDESGKVVNERIKSGEEVTISNPSVSKLNVMSDIIPDKYSLEQNYPNPFNPTTTIEFSLPEDVENVRLTIYNALGEKVAELVNGKMEAGRYRYQWNAGNVATGLYIYELKTNKFSSVKKMMLLK